MDARRERIEELRRKYSAEFASPSPEADRTLPERYGHAVQAILELLTMLDEPRPVADWMEAEKRQARVDEGRDVLREYRSDRGGRR